MLTSWMQEILTILKTVELKTVFKEFQTYMSLTHYINFGFWVNN